MNRPGWPLGAVLLAGGAIAATPILALLARSWRARVAVEGHSMEPTLRPGDWLLVDPDAYRDRPPAVGELVVAIDPRDRRRWLIKRVVATNADGSLRLAGDHSAHADDAALGALPAEALIGRPWLRYWPLRRVGRLRERLGNEDLPQ